MTCARFLPVWFGWGNPLDMEIVLPFNESSAYVVSLTLGRARWAPPPVLRFGELKLEQTVA